MPKPSPRKESVILEMYDVYHHATHHSLFHIETYISCKLVFDMRKIIRKNLFNELNYVGR